MYKPVREVKVDDALVNVIPRGPTWRDAAREKLAEDGLDPIIARFAGARPRAVVTCSVASSMVSGSWGLVKFRIGSRGYLCYWPGSSDEGEAQLIGAWEPADNKRAFRAAVLQTWVREWSGCALSPAMGEFASGPAALLRQAVTLVLSAHPDAWRSGCSSVSSLTIRSAADSTSPNLRYPLREVRYYR